MRERERNRERENYHIIRNKSGTYINILLFTIFTIIINSPIDLLIARFSIFYYLYSFQNILNRLTYHNVVNVNLLHSVLLLI